jgi:hypothetical protein
MAAWVTVGADEIRIELTGWNALPSLRRTVRIPVGAVRSIRTERFPVEVEGAHTGVSATLTGVRSGSLARDGRRYLLAYRPGVPTVTLELDRARFPELGYDAVVLGVDPEAVELDSRPAA